MTAEVWAAIPGRPGYEASTEGRIRSIDRAFIRRDGKLMRRRGRSLAPQARPDGRLVVQLSGRTRPVGLLVLETFVGPRPAGMECCHRDDDQTNNRLTNLRWDTSRENKLDQIRNGNHELVNRTHCPRRHALILPNLVASKLRIGHRQCLACHRARGYLARHPELGDALVAVSDRYHAEIMREAA